MDEQTVFGAWCRGLLMNHYLRSISVYGVVGQRRVLCICELIQEDLLPIQKD